jgi:hypothetical protein
MEPKTMRRSSVALAALLFAAPAFAQTTTTPPADKPMATPSTSADGQWYTHRSDDMRASKLLGSSVTNTANESVGDINDVILGKDGRVAAVIVGVGGFLGMGEREVAMSYSALRFSRDTNGRDVITVNTTKDQLKNAPAWKWEPIQK